MKSFLEQVRSRPELLILLLMLIIISMLVIPLPTFLIDFLIGTNIVIAILVFLGSFYIERILNFSSFPSILLITTLFRLALSISTSRLILLQADAGRIIETFGQFVIGDSLVVGFVIFFIVTIVQFIVITKGSERVAEVAARFSLDGMPGKQMSIDADLKAGIIDAEGAKTRRSVLERESQLYGSFDGAMKFIKGDAIAGIIIIFVNFIGGISVGMGQQNMDLSHALDTYTILTIGDGLVGQIPALLISISAGFIVTRVSGDGNNLGKTIMSQLMGSQFVLIVTAVLALACGLLPGFPFFAFVSLAAALAGYYFYKRQALALENGASGSGRRTAEGALGESALNPAEASLDDYMTETIPLALILNDQQKGEIEPLKLNKLIRNQFFSDYGIKLPELQVRYSNRVQENGVLVLINEVNLAQYTVPFSRAKIINYNAELAALQLDIEFINDKQGKRGAWIRNDEAPQLTAMGYQIRHASDELYQCLSSLFSQTITEFFGIQETKNLLDQMESKYPDLVKEAYRHASVQRVAEVLQRLVQEKISIRNMKMVLEALAQWASREKDVIALVEYVRGAMARYISHRFAYSNELKVLVLSPDIEERIRQGIRQTSSGTFLNLEPEHSERILDQLAVGMESVSVAQKDLVLVSSVDIRRFVKKLIETRFEDLAVLSFAEISESINVNVLKTI